ncbi:Phage gp6-like head-tail connector protein [Clostridium baratii]|uniref:phage head-tail connector protein n=1 Tax=Clostridium baratii TaxID=1561 RepID=UPI0006C30BA8|nr:phage head-tail connector protein [Clostridium baratii]CUP05976.1 Phage gp6-like head-tail connector protein [Clostridium baratii]
MDKIELLEKIQRRSISASNQEDKLILDLIDETQEEIKEFTHREDIPPSLEGSLIELVVIKCNRLGTEGISSESFSGVSTSYLNGFPKYIEKKLRKCRKLP